MSCVLWVGDDDHDENAVDIGDTLSMFGAFSDIAKAVKGGNGWDELMSVPQFSEQVVDANWFAKVKEQAARYRREKRPESPRVSVVLDALLA